MIWKFIKANWFSVALALLVVVAIARKGLRIRFDQPGDRDKRELKGGKTEKFTDAGAPPDGSSRAGILPDAAQPTQALPAIEEATAVAFLRRFGNVAVSERKKFGVPASVLLAVAYVNSFSGTRETAQQANNYFALSCSAEWEGQQATLGGRCFRRYDTAWESYRDFSIYLSSQAWFGAVRQEAGTDWRKWVPALAQHDISDVSNFEAEMTRVIQAYRLFELDAR